MASDPREIDAHDLLVAVAVDLSGSDRGAQVCDRIAASLLHGMGGDVRSGTVGGASLASRPLRSHPAGRAPRIRPAEWVQADDGSFTLMAGTIHHRAETCARLGIASRGTPAADYAAIRARFGDECDRLIVGNYAVLQWFPGDRRLRIARSPTGFYPMHVWRSGDFVVAASIPRALFAAGAPDEIDPDMVGDRLLLNPQCGTRSWYREHRRVPPATVEVHDRAGSRCTAFWSFATIRPVRFKRDEDYVEAVHEQMGRALDASLEGTQRCAIHLSGGLDSQAVASYALDRLPPGETLRAFTAVPMAGTPDRAPPGRFDDESEHVRALAAMFPERIETTFVDAASHAFGDRLDTLLMLGSWPTINEGIGAWTHPALEIAAASGCDTILNAGFGNMTFSYDGETGFPTWLRRGRLARLMRELAMVHDDQSLAWRFAARAVLPNLPASMQRSIARMRGGRGAFPRWSPLREDFAGASGALDRLAAAGLDDTSARAASGAEWRQDAWQWGFADGPEIQTALALMYGVQDRDPMAYLALVELCAGIPDDQYLREGQQRWLARRLLKGRIPELVRLETRRGRQNADWPERFERDRASLAAELSSLENDDTVSAMIDVPRLAADLAGWAGPQAASAAERERIRDAVGMGLTVARFLRYNRRRNAG